MRFFHIGLLCLAALWAVPASANDYPSLLKELRAKLPSEARVINAPGIASWQVNGTSDSQLVAAPEIGPPPLTMKPSPA
jgi:hypothetical protein